MLLFCDGFETFSPYDLWRKWGYANWSKATAPNINPQIVHGMDQSHFPFQPHARRNDGRALQGPCSLLTTIKPSRTLFMGFAFRVSAKGAYGNPEFTVKFFRNYRYDKRWFNGPYDGVGTFPMYGYSAESTYGYTGYYFESNIQALLIAQCFIKVESTRIRVQWSFQGDTLVGTNDYFGVKQDAYLNSYSTLDDGSWHYIQVGLTLMGNVAAQPQAWATVFLDNQELTFSDIMTCPEGNIRTSFHFNAVGLDFGRLNALDYGIGSIDDFYICNDEGPANNTFLGPIHIKRLSVTGDGSYTDGIPTGAGYRFQTVDEDYIDTVNALPSPLPNPEQNPLFITWEDFRSTYTTLMERTDKETMRFASLNAQGVYPKIYGAVLHSLLNPLYKDTPATIKAVRRLSNGTLVESNAMDAPLVKDTEYEHRQFTWDNAEVIDYEAGEQYINWNPSAFDASEWGFILEPVAIDPKTYDYSVLRITIIRDELIDEEMALDDFTHRFFEETADDEMALTVDPAYEYTWRFDDVIYLETASEGNRGGNRFLNETLEFSEYIPYVDLFINDYLCLQQEDIFVQYADFIGDEFATADWSDGYWEELFADSFIISDEDVLGLVLFLDDALGLEEPYLWDNHEDLGDTFAIDADEPWDNHEQCDEYLYPDDFAQDGYGLEIEEYFGLEEDHFDGYWVEVMGDQTDILDHILTQHWRYDIVFGMVLDSWQMIPIEQYGNDGVHTGDNPWGA